LQILTQPLAVELAAKVLSDQHPIIADHCTVGRKHAR